MGNARASIRGTDDSDDSTLFLCRASRSVRQLKRPDMSTLCNVDSRGDGAVSPSAGFVASSIPEAGNVQKGVSVRYALNPGKQWWVVRATYGREEKAYQFITTDTLDTDAYCAMHYVRKLVGGKYKRLLEPLVPSILFVYCSEDQIYHYVKRTPQLSYLRFYYNHCVGGTDALNPPVTVGYEEMMNFIRLTSIDDENIIKVDKAFVHYKSGDEVIVTEGKFAGIKGRVARVAGQQRIIVNLSDVALVATAYVPSTWIEKI